MHLILFLIVGGIAGVMAGKIMSGHGYGIVVDVILGIVGGLVGGWLVSTFLGIQTTGLIVSFIVALIGACILVALVHLIKREPIRS
ncbi:MAG: GlsB/YeaQ/YmgE family stress response membrane protein [Candidatus Dormibacteraeota bacterium]|nr:GlsB/YeaQ/YmgE family stress response membrane protein [Candidatus Dormibacteraeota bacterium]